MPPPAAASPGPPPTDQHAALRQFEILAELTDGEMEQLSTYVERSILPSREILFRQGDAGDSLYLVVCGRLHVVLEDGAREMIVGEIGRGECVGEMALLTNEPRSATVRAARDTVLLRLTRQRFEELLGRSPEVSLHLTRVLALRLREANAARPRRASPAVIAVVPAAGEPAGEFTARLAEALGGPGTAAVVSVSRARAELGEDGSGTESARLAAWLDRIEAAHRFVLLRTEPAEPDWRRRCIRQADLVLTVARAGADPRAHRPRPHAGTEPDGDGPPRELVLLHGAEASRATGSAAWLADDTFTGHHHLRAGRDADFRRLARHLAGRSVGLVLGGGGARGFAHIGVLRALEEAGIPIDRIAGTSMGAVVAAQYAVGYPLSELVELNRLWARYRVHGGYTVPVVSLITGKSGKRMLDRMFGGVCIEDLWLPFFCVAANLTRAQAEIQDRGDLVEALAASISIPGIAPPRVTPAGDLLVDGGVVDNVPASEMQGRGSGPVIAVDVSPDVELWADRIYRSQPSTMRILADRLNPFSRAERFPSIFRILQRASLLASIREAQSVRRSVDLYLAPPVSGFDIFDWRAVQHLADTGYRYARERLAAADITDAAALADTSIPLEPFTAQTPR